MNTCVDWLFKEIEIISSLNYYNQAGLGVFLLLSHFRFHGSVSVSQQLPDQEGYHSSAKCKVNFTKTILMCAHLQPLQLVLGLHLPAHPAIRIFLRLVRTQMYSFVKLK